jgi:hypothetical protein
VRKPSIPLDVRTRASISGRAKRCGLRAALLPLSCAAACCREKGTGAPQTVSLSSTPILPSAKALPAAAGCIPDNGNRPPQSPALRASRQGVRLRRKVHARRQRSPTTHRPKAKPSIASRRQAPRIPIPTSRPKAGPNLLGRQAQERTQKNKKKAPKARLNPVLRAAKRLTFISHRQGRTLRARPNAAPRTPTASRATVAKPSRFRLPRMQQKRVA